MMRQQNLNYLPLVGVTLLCLLVVVYLFARKRSSQPEPTASVARHSVEKPADDVLKYWTADKMSSAKAAPMPTVDAVDQKKRQPRRQPEA